MTLLSTSYGWILDVALLVVLLAGLVAGTIFGFVRGISKITGIVLSLAFAVFFSAPFTSALDEMFGIVSKFGGAIGSDIAAYWLCTIGSFIVLTAVMRITVFLIGKLGKSIVDNSAGLTRADRLLGGLLGLSEAALATIVLMIVLKWLQIDALNTLITESKAVGSVYNGEWFEWLAFLPAKIIIYQS